MEAAYLSKINITIILLFVLHLKVNFLSHKDIPTDFFLFFTFHFSFS